MEVVLGIFHDNRMVEPLGLLLLAVIAGAAGAAVSAVTKAVALADTFPAVSLAKIL